MGGQIQSCRRSSAQRAHQLHRVVSGFTICHCQAHNAQSLRFVTVPCVIQVHDEVILEGPKASAEEAQKIVVDCMENPFDGQPNVLKVALEVSSNIADTWYEAK